MTRWAAAVMCLGLAACGRDVDPCPHGHMMRFVPTPEITAYELAQILSELRGVSFDLRATCVQENSISGVVEKFFKEEKK